MDKRASRIIKAQKNVIDFILNNISKEFVLISKWGGDGSTGHSEFKERSCGDASDNNILIKSAVPLQLCSTKTFTDKFILWQIPRPSVSCCLPMRREFKKETAESATE